MSEIAQMGIGRKSRKEYNDGAKCVAIHKEARAMRRVFILSGIHCLARAQPAFA
jgi:hypothetical protein